MWVRFTDAFRWSPEPGWSQVYQPCEMNVPTPCAEAAIAAGKAVKIATPKKEAKRGRRR